MELYRVFREVRVSVNEHLGLVAKRWWALVVTGAGGVLGLIALTVPSHKVGQPLVPTWLWLTLLFGGVIVAQFLAFHDVRKERDRIKEETRVRFSDVWFRFQMVMLLGGPREFVSTGKGVRDFGCRFEFRFSNGGLDPLEFYVESLSMKFESDPNAAPGGDLDSRGGVILPGRDFSFYYRVVLSPLPKGGFLPVGEGQYSIVYFHASGDRSHGFRTRHKFKIGWDIDGAAVQPNWVTVGK